MLGYRNRMLELANENTVLATSLKCLQGGKKLSGFDTHDSTEAESRTPK